MNNKYSINTIDIIIVNWNTGDQLRDCLNSIKKALINWSQIANIIVVDNASKDNSLQGIKEIFPSLILIENPTNKGFGAACNQGAYSSKSKYILFLNPDTILTTSSLAVPFNFMEAEENIRYTACGIQMINENGEISRSCARFPKLHHFFFDIFGLSKLYPKSPLSLHMHDWDHKESKDVDHIIGAFYFIRRNIFEDLGGFDERFFVYLEDLDLSKRIYKHGYKLRYIQESQCYHKGGGVSEQIKDIRLFYSLRSRLIYGFIHLNTISAISLLLGTMIIEPFTRLILVLLSGSFSNIKNTIKAYTLLYCSIPNIYKTIKQKS